jgi:hypothetical protein
VLIPRCIGVSPRNNTTYALTVISSLSTIVIGKKWQNKREGNVIRGVVYLSSCTICLSFYQHKLLYAECSLSCRRWWRRHSSFQGFFDKPLNAHPGCPVNPTAADLSPTSHKVSGDTHVRKGVCFWTWRDCCVWFFSRARSSVLRRRSKLFAGRYRHIVYCIVPRRVHFRLALRIQLRVDQRAKAQKHKRKTWRFLQTQAQFGSTRSRLQSRWPA